MDLLSRSAALPPPARRESALLLPPGVRRCSAGSRRRRSPMTELLSPLLPPHGADPLRRRVSDGNASRAWRGSGSPGCQLLSAHHRSGRSDLRGSDAERRSASTINILLLPSPTPLRSTSRWNWGRGMAACCVLQPSAPQWFVFFFLLNYHKLAR